jgi:hypothetical protein
MNKHLEEIPLIKFPVLVHYMGIPIIVILLV